MTHAPVMIIEDDADLREAIHVTLDLNKIPHETMANAEDGLISLDRREYSLVITDFRLPGIDGLTLLRSVRKKLPQLPVVVMTAFAEAKLAVEALQSGARDFLIKPFQPEHLVEVIGRHQPSMGPADAFGFAVIAKAPTTQEILKRCERVASTTATILFTGESGVGKDIFARFIHARSPRREKPYVAINCAAIPGTLLESTLFGFEKGAFTGATKAQEGKFELANGGTLFLDEIGELPIDLQAKLLRALQERMVERIGSNRSVGVDVRIIAATNRNLADRVREGGFREDLYYRLAVFPIPIAPLRERMEDLIPLTELFIERYSQTMGRPRLLLSGEATKTILNYEWPGNVRELENAIQRAILLCDGQEICPSHLELEGAATPGRSQPAPLPSAGQVAQAESSGPEIATELGSSATQSLEAIEREHILKVLTFTDGNRKKAIEILGISGRALRYKLKEYRERGFYSGKE